MSLSFNGEYLISGSCDKTIRVWDWETESLEKIFEDNSLKISKVAMSENEKFLVSCSVECIKIWNFENKTLHCVFSFSRKEFRSFVCKENFVVAGLSDMSVRIWNIESKKETCLNCHLDMVKCLVVSKNSLNIVTGGQDSHIRIWNAKKKKHKALLNGHSKEIISLCITKNDKYLVSGSYDRTFRIWKLSNLLN